MGPRSGVNGGRYGRFLRLTRFAPASLTSLRSARETAPRGMEGVRSGGAKTLSLLTFSLPVHPLHPSPSPSGAPWAGDGGVEWVDGSEGRRVIAARYGPFRFLFHFHSPLSLSLYIRGPMLPRLFGSCLSPHHLITLRPRCSASLRATSFVLRLSLRYATVGSREQEEPVGNELRPETKSEGRTKRLTM